MVLMDNVSTIIFAEYVIVIDNGLSDRRRNNEVFN